MMGYMHELLCELTRSRIISEAHYTISQDHVANDSRPKGHTIQPQPSDPNDALQDFDFDSFLHNDDRYVLGQESVLELLTAERL